MRDGQIVAQFAHRRIREKPPSGGVSVLCESICAPEEALVAQEGLLEKWRWFGVAMVEFKCDRRDSVPKLMEVNARFWGSLQLAISAGVDFPFLLCRLANNEKIDKQSDYEIGLKSRWELGDLDHLLIRLRRRKKDSILPYNAPSRGKVLVDFIGDFFNPSVKHEVLRSDNPKPFFWEFRRYFNRNFP